MEPSFEDHAGGGAAHVLAIPLTIPGHITPMLRFMIRLLAHKGITVSFICYEDEVPSLPSSGGTDASSELRSPNFRFVTLPKPRIEGLNILTMLEKAFEPFMEKLTRDKKAGIAGPTCIVSDMFLPWTWHVAEKLQIPRYMLISSGILYARYMQGTLPYFESGKFQVSETDGTLVEFDWPLCIPGLHPLRFYEIDLVMRIYTPVYRQAAESMMKSAGVVVNSFSEFEEKIIQAFQNPGQFGEKQTKVPKLYPVGPLFSPTALTHSSSIFGLEDSSSHCLGWLDSQPSASVLYVAFGSLVRLRPDQITEMAYGLEASNQRFLWVCPLKKIDSAEESPSSITEVLPPDFEARVGDRGCIVTGWAPQLQILAHSSTGGSFTHSGWNSTLESVIFGVPMISWPQDAEQHINCKYLVNDLKIAEQFQSGKEQFVKRNEVERVVRLLMVDSEGATIRSRAQEFKRKAAAAMAEGGSQSRVLQEFLKDILLP